MGIVSVDSPSVQAASEWDALADACGAGPFVRPGWFEAWMRAFAPGREPELVSVRRGARLVGVLPLLPRYGGRSSPTNWHTPAFGAVAADDDAVRDLAAAALASSGAWLDCSFLDPAEPFTRALLDQADARHVIARPALRSPYLRLEGEWDSYRETKPSKFWREIRRRRRRLEDDHGAVSVEFVDGRENLDALLTEGLAVEGSGWKTDRGTAITQDPTIERFYREVAAWAAQQGWLQLGFVRVEQRAVAFSYAIVLHGIVHVVKVGFDPAFGRYAVGTLLTSHAIERAFEQGQRVYDFLGSEDAYKLDWTGDVRERIRVQAFSRGPLGTAAHAAWRYGRPAVRRVRPR
jgi:CelD/BcsL family acetyltransferase involved in cellulose biosynthesis